MSCLNIHSVQTQTHTQTVQAAVQAATLNFSSRLGFKNIPTGSGEARLTHMPCTRLVGVSKVSDAYFRLKALRCPPSMALLHQDISDADTVGNLGRHQKVHAYHPVQHRVKRGSQYSTMHQCGEAVPCPPTPLFTTDH